MTFWHFIDMEDMGEFRVIQKLGDAQGTITEVESLKYSRSQGPFWRLGFAEMFATDVMWKVVFQATAGNYTMILKYVIYKTYTYKVVPYVCKFTFPVSHRTI